MNCTIHSARKLIKTKTRYGSRWICPVGGCTVVWWGGKTLPADYHTRLARTETHTMFDEIWKSGTMKRKEAYRKLSKFLGIPRGQTHIGLFSVEQCGDVQEFVRAIMRP